MLSETLRGNKGGKAQNKEAGFPGSVLNGINRTARRGS
jgi:hypothetical protein